MSQTVGKIGATSIFYGVYFRQTATYVRPTTLALITAELDLADQMGYVEKDSLISKIEAGDLVEAQRQGDCVEVPQDYTGTFEFTCINGTEANIDDVLDQISTINAANKNIDVILYDPTSERFQIIKDVPPIFGEETGSKSVFTMRVKKIIADPANFRDRFSFAGFPAA